MLEGFGIGEHTEEDKRWILYITDLCDKNIWLTAVKEEIRINDMTNSHIENCIKSIKDGAKIRGLADKYLPKLEAELENRKDLL